MAFTPKFPDVEKIIAWAIFFLLLFVMGVALLGFKP